MLHCYELGCLVAAEIIPTHSVNFNISKGKVNRWKPKLKSLTLKPVTAMMCDKSDKSFGVSPPESFVEIPAGPALVCQDGFVPH